MNYSCLSITRYIFNCKRNKSNYTSNNVRGTFKTKSKYIHLRKIKIQNENKLTCGSLQVVISTALELKSWKALVHIISDSTRRSFPFIDL